MYDCRSTYYGSKLYENGAPGCWTLNLHCYNNTISNRTFWCMKTYLFCPLEHESHKPTKKVHGTVLYDVPFSLLGLDYTPMFQSGDPFVLTNKKWWFVVNFFFFLLLCDFFVGFVCVSSEEVYVVFPIGPLLVLRRWLHDEIYLPSFYDDLKYFEYNVTERKSFLSVSNEKAFVKGRKTKWHWITRLSLNTGNYYKDEG